MGQSTDPAFVTNEIEPPSLPKKRSTSPIDAISPQLPEFSFSQPLTSGSELRADVLGNESYVSRFGYGIDPELTSERSPAESVEDNPPTSATFAYSLHSEYSRESQEDVEAGNRRTSREDSSLDVVENDLDYLRSRMSYFQGGNGEKRKSTGPLPKRSSVQGVFDVLDQLPNADNQVKEVPQFTQGNLVVPERFPGSSLGTALPQPVRAASGQCGFSERRRVEFSANDIKMNSDGSSENVYSDGRSPSPRGQLRMLHSQQYAVGYSYEGSRHDFALRIAISRVGKSYTHQPRFYSDVGRQKIQRHDPSQSKSHQDQPAASRASQQLEQALHTRWERVV